MIPTEDNAANRNFVSKLWGYIKGFGARLVVHTGALLCAAVMTGTSGGGFVFLGTYLGLICLVARETSMTTKWIVPTGLGLLQSIVGVFIGLPLYQCIFWGGFQAFLQRAMAKKFSLGLEWFVSIFLLPIALDSLLSLNNSVEIIGSFLAIGIVGAIFWRIFTARQNGFKKVEKNPVEQLKPVEPPVDDLDPFKDYRDSIAKLRIKQILLPRNMQQSVQALSTSAEAIIICMTEDKRDTDAGKRFLNRYLPATHSVLDNYRKHCKDAPNNLQVANALAQSEEVLNRLEQAFAHEHNHLLRNNIDDFSADLRVLDTLLKMEGH